MITLLLDSGTQQTESAEQSQVQEKTMLRQEVLASIQNTSDIEETGPSDGGPSRRLIRSCSRDYQGSHRRPVRYSKTFDLACPELDLLVARRLCKLPKPDAVLPVKRMNQEKAFTANREELLDIVVGNGFANRRFGGGNFGRSSGRLFQQNLFKKRSD